MADAQKGGEVVRSTRLGSRLLRLIRGGGPLPVLDPCRPRTQGASQQRWPGEPPACSVCGRRLLAGERAVSYQHPDGVIDACPLCAIELSGAGLRLVTGDQSSPGDGTPEGEAA